MIPDNPTCIGITRDTSVRFTAGSRGSQMRGDLLGYILSSTPPAQVWTFSSAESLRQRGNRNYGRSALISLLGRRTRTGTNSNKAGSVQS
jgi:hypothetical protein